MRIWLTIAAAVLFATSCAPAQQSSAGVSSQRDSSLGAAPFDEITLQRTECYGTCPAYTVILHGDGTVVYKGKSHVVAIGERKSSISKASVSFLLSAFGNASFLSFQDEYGSERDGCKEVWTDHPSLMIRYQSKANSKSVSYYTGCVGAKDLHKIAWLADTIDIVTNTRQWVGGK